MRISRFAGRLPYGWCSLSLCYCWCKKQSNGVDGTRYGDSPKPTWSPRPAQAWRLLSISMVRSSATEHQGSTSPKRSARRGKASGAWCTRREKSTGESFVDWYAIARTEWRRRRRRSACVSPPRSPHSSSGPQKRSSDTWGPNGRTSQSHGVARSICSIGLGHIRCWPTKSFTLWRGMRPKGRLKWEVRGADGYRILL